MVKSSVIKIWIGAGLVLLALFSMAGCRDAAAPTASAVSANTITAAITPPEPTESSLPAPAATGTAVPTETAIPTETPTPTGTPSPSPTPTSPPVRFAVIGDYGLAGAEAQAVSELVKGWQPDFIITTGDNNYPNGSAETIDENIGQYYAEYIFPYTGTFDPGTAVPIGQNRFFPTLGNHDWDAPGIDPYLTYFTLPGNERYYDFTWGPVHLFALDTDSREPDGVSAGSVQAAWLEERLAASDLPWKIVYGHLSPYSSGIQSGIAWMDWPFQAWGATVLLAAHDHLYERIVRDGFPILINGLGGGPRYEFEEIVPGSELRYRDKHGAVLITADWRQITFQFFAVGGELIDEYRIENS
ncbi:MAG: metallophosphoesterase [Candidatus Promineifilaceae bacterium]